MLKQDLFTISSETDFLKTALKVFQFQYKHNVVYRRFCDYLKVDITHISTLKDIPFLPIQFFKSEAVITSKELKEHSAYNLFTSSGTTGTKASKHYVSDISIYEESFNKAFQQFYGPASDYVILALLPSYLEREGSSLIYMTNALIEQSNHADSGFYLHNVSELATKLRVLDAQGQKILLIGVSFALLDLVESETFQLQNTTIMETGGMKGRRREMIREELHEHLKKGFGVTNIHSEYGMTELLSQAYSQGDGVFKCPPFMKLLIRDPEDALSYLPQGKTGGINVIDLANMNSCSFIATQDLGKQLSATSFEILGRFDHSDIRGCNLMAL